jgi:hypothetical protein
MQAGVLSPDPERLRFIPAGAPSGSTPDPTVRKRLTDIGQEIFPRDRQTPEALYAFHKAESERWWPIIKGAGIKNE